MKNLSKQKLQLTPLVQLAKLTFSEQLGRAHSTYRDHLVQALQGNMAVTILSANKYMLQQFKNAAKKLKLRLVFAVDGDNLHIKPMRLEGEGKRLLLLLREPRTLSELKSKGLECDLDTELKIALGRGVVKEAGKGRYQCTEAGLKLLIE
jgi:hypothetical protein